MDWRRSLELSAGTHKFTKKTGIEAQAVGIDTRTLKLSTLADYEAGFTPGDVVVMPWPARIVSDAKAGHLLPVGDLYKPEEQTRAGR